MEEERIDLAVRPVFPEYEHWSNPGSANAHFNLVPVSGNSLRKEIEGANRNPLYVSKDSAATKAAGAIAQTVRNGYQLFVCSAVGPYAILCTVKSIFLAHKYLEEEALYLSFAPEFVTLDEGGSGMHL